MKKAILIFLLAFGVHQLHAAVFTSVASGNYNAPATWSFVGADADGIPDSDDDVTIAGGTSILLTGTQDCKTLTIDPGGLINLNVNTMRVYGSMTNNGTSTGTGSWQFRGAGTYTGHNLPNYGYIYFYANYTIAAGVVINKGGYIVMSSGITVSNFASVTLSTASLQLLSGAKWINKAGSAVSVATNVVSAGTIDASAAPNSFIYSTGGTTEVQAANATYYNLVLNAGAGANTKIISSTLNILNDLTINSNVTLNCNNQNINIGGNWTNSANTTCTNMGTVNFNGSGTQTITRAATETFNNFTISGTGTVLLATNTKVNGTTALNSGTLDPSSFNYAQKGASFNDNGGSINTAATGRITFNGNIAQTINGTIDPSFGNLTFNTTGTVTLARNISVFGTTGLTSGTVDPSTFTYHQKGTTWSADGGTLNIGAPGTVVFDGTADQFIDGTVGNTFGNIQFNNPGNTIQINRDQVVKGTSTLTAGTLDVQTFTYHQKGASWLSNGASINTAATGEVSFDAGLDQTIGGTAGITFGNIEIANPGFNVTLAHDQSAVGTMLLTSGTFSPSTFIFHFKGASWNGNGGSVNVGVSGEIEFDGTANQSIAGTVGNNFGNIEFNNPGNTIQITRDQVVKGTTTLTAGTFDPQTFIYHQQGASWAGNGGFLNTGATGRIAFDGIVAQTIGGSPGITFGNFEINNAAGVSTTAVNSLASTGTLTMTTGTFTSSTIDFTFISDAGSTARIGAVAGGGFAGTKWVLQRFVAVGGVNGSQPYWDNFSSPVVASTILDWDNEMYMSGVGGSDGNACCPVFYSVRTMSGSVTTNVTSTATALGTAKGFMIWTADNLNTFSGLLCDTRGTPKTGVVAKACASGFDLVGNPYMSQIDFASLTRAGGLSGNNYFYILDETLQNYAYWDGAAGNGTGKLAGSGGVINSTQGFYVNASGAGTLTFNESSKTAALTTFVRQTAQNDVVQIKLTRNDGQPLGALGQISFDPAGDDNATNLDIPALRSPDEFAPYMRTLSNDGNELFGNRLGSSADSHSVPLIITPNLEGDYTLNFSGLDQLSAYECVYLEDPATGKFVDLKQNASYTFSVTDGTKDVNFILHFDHPVSDANGNQSCRYAPSDATGNSFDADVFANADGLNLGFHFSDPTAVKVNVYDVVGKEIMNRQIVVSDDKLIYKLPETHGVYLVRLQSGDRIITKKIYR